jgi:hypothetical protein
LSETISRNFFSLRKVVATIIEELGAQWRHYDSYSQKIKLIDKHISEIKDYTRQVNELSIAVFKQEALVETFLVKKNSYF